MIKVVLFCFMLILAFLSSGQHLRNDDYVEYKSIKRKRLLALCLALYCVWWLCTPIHAVCTVSDVLGLSLAFCTLLLLAKACLFGLRVDFLCFHECCTFCWLLWVFWTTCCPTGLDCFACFCCLGHFVSELVFVFVNFFSVVHASDCCHRVVDANLQDDVYICRAEYM